MALTLRDSHSYETQIIDAVRGVNRALGGTYGTSSAIHKPEFNQYEVQLIDAIKGIGRTLSGNGLSFAGGGAFQRGGEQGANDGIGDWKFLASGRFHRFFEILEGLSKGGVIGGGIFVRQEEIGSHGEEELLPFGGGPAIGTDRCCFIRIMEKSLDEFQK